MLGECTKCHNFKELVKGKKFCKICKNSYERERRSKQDEKKKQEFRDKEKERYYKKKKNINIQNINLEGEKNCTKCNIKKKLTDFYLAKNKGTIRSICKECSSNIRKKYYQDNKEDIIRQTSKYKSEKIKTNPFFKLEVRLRSRIYTAFTVQNKSKNDRTWKYINCSPTFFQEWINFQLYDGMTIENYGKVWHIDHVVPCSKFDLSKKEDIEKCFCWKNLRPLLAKKNRNKYDKINTREIMFQELKVKCFEDLKRSEKLSIQDKGQCPDVNC